MSDTTTDVHDRIRFASDWKVRAGAQGIKLGRIPVTHDKLAEKVRALAEDAKDEQSQHEIAARRAATRVETLTALADEVSADLPDLLRALRAIETASAPPVVNEPERTGGEV